MAENAGSIYAEIRLELQQLSADVKRVKEKFANMGSHVDGEMKKLSSGVDGTMGDLKNSVSGAIGAVPKAIEKNASEAIAKLKGSIDAAKKRIGELNKVKIHPLEVELELDKLKGDISAAKRRLKELSSIEAPAPEIQLEMERLKGDINAAQEKFRELSNVKITPPEVRLELDGLEDDVSAAEAKIKELESGMGDAFSGLPDFIGGPLRKAIGMVENSGEDAVSATAKTALGMKKAIMAVPIVGLIVAAAGSIKKIIGSVMQFINSTADAWIAHQQEIAKLNNLIQATGAIAWTSGRQVQAMAMDLSNSSGRAVNEIMAMQSIMLSFRNVTGDIFERANRAIVDMASVMGKDLASAANAVGRALDAPIEGLRALGRQGIIFTKTEQRRIEEMVNAGQIAEAQSYILRELELSFQGTAAAINDVNLAQQRLNNAEERIAIARGERTHGIRNWWTELRAARAEVRAFHREYFNMINRASNADFSSAITYAERMRSRLEEARGDMDELEFELAQDRVVTVELELHREKAKADMLVAMKDMELLWVTMTGTNRAFVLDLEEAFNAGGEALSDFLDAALDAAGHISPLRYQAFREEAKMLRIYQQQIAAIDGRLAAHGNSAAARTRYHNEQMAQMEQVNELAEKLTLIEQNRINTLQEIARAEAVGLMSAEMAEQSRLAAYRREAEAINTVITMSNSLRITNARAQQENAEVMDRLNSAIKAATSNYLALHAAVSRFTPATIGDLNNHIDEVLRALNHARRHYQDQLSRGAIDTEQFAELIAGAYQQATASLDSFNRQHGIMWEQNQSAFGRVRGLYARVESDLERVARKAQEAAEAGWNAEIGNEIALANARRINDLEAIREIERRIAEERLREEEVFQNASEEGQRAMLETSESLRRAVAGAELAEMLARFQSKTEQLSMTSLELLRAQREEALHLASAFSDLGGEYDKLRDTINAYFDELERMESRSGRSWQSMAQNVMQYAGQVAQIVSALGRLHAQSVRSETEMLRRELRERTAMLREQLAAEMQERLHAKGFVEAATEAQHERELQLAMESGDQQRIFEAHSNMERFLIEEEFAQKKLELDEYLAKREQALSHRAAVAQWRMQVLNAKVSAAMAVLSGFATQPFVPAGIVAGALAGGLGAAQIALVKANRPRLQSFNSGGIVAGNSFSGDSVMARVNSGEMILTRQQQQSLFDRISGNDLGGEKTVNAHIQICLDRKVIGDAVIKDINNRTYLIDAGSIR